MLFLILDLLLIFNIYIVLGIKSQIIDNDTLIYNRDVYHNATQYCHFGTKQQIQKKFSPECFERNKEMRHFSASGEQTYPYIGGGYVKPEDGTMLVCGDIPRGKLLFGCQRYVHSNCSYECEENDVRTMRCYLVGPWTNVTAQWSDPNPCPDHVVTPVVEGDTPIITTEFIIAVVIPSVLFVFLIIGAIVLCRRRLCQKCRHQEQITAQDTSVSSPEGSGTLHKDEDHNPEEMPMMENNTPDQNPEGLPLLDNNNLPDQNPEGLPLLDNNNLPENSKVVPLIQQDLEVPSLGIGELQIPIDFGSPYNRETFNKPKDFIDKKLESAYARYSPMHTGSLDDIRVVYVSCTGDSVMCSKAAKIEKVVPACPSTCSASVDLLKQQTNSFRRNLRPELEVLPGRSREQALIGFIEENAQKLGYSQSHIEMIEMSCKSNFDVKASDYFLQRLAEYGIKLGFVVQYLYTHGNYKAVEVILEVHRGCEYCERFRGC